MDDAVVHLGEVGVGGDDDSGHGHSGSVRFMFSVNVGVAVTMMWRSTVWQCSAFTTLITSMIYVDTPSVLLLFAHPSHR